MKIIKRYGVFETNSSSTHTLALVSKKDYEADKQKEKPKYRRYGVIDNKYDKLLMACGCCEELFVTEADIDRYASWGDEANVERKRDCDEVKAMLAVGAGDQIVMKFDSVSYEVAIGFIVRVYCELTGDDYDTVYKQVDSENRTGSVCHMKFFDEGALYDERWDYELIVNLFQYNNESEALDSIRRYFDDDYVLCYREYYGGVRWDDED